MPLEFKKEFKNLNINLEDMCCNLVEIGTELRHIRKAIILSALFNKGHDGLGDLEKLLEE